MATITANIKPRAGGQRVILWETMGDDDSGSAVETPDYPDKTFEVIGTFASATVILQGSSDGVVWTTLVDDTDTALSFTAASGFKLVKPNPLFIRAKTSGGSGTDVDVYVMATKAGR